MTYILYILILIFFLCVIYLIWNMDFGLDEMFETWDKEDKILKEKKETK